MEEAMPTPLFSVPYTESRAFGRWLPPAADVRMHLVAHARTTSMIGIGVNASTPINTRCHVKSSGQP
jgi:hypothetical protein